MGWDGVRPTDGVWGEEVLWLRGHGVLMYVPGEVGLWGGEEDGEVGAGSLIMPAMEQ